jgi:hypothetical protein
MTVGYAAAIEAALDAKTIGGARAQRVLLDLTLVLSGFGGPQAELYQELFAPALDAAEGKKEHQARPTLDHDLQEIGAWASETARRIADTLPPDQAARARARLAFERGHYAEVVAIAQKQPKTSRVWQGWAGAALTLLGKEREAAPLASAAERAGGEAERIVRIARARWVLSVALDRAARALKAAGVTVVGAASGGHKSGVEQSCSKLFEDSTITRTPERANAAVPCATVLWERPSRDWLPRAAALAPDGAPGAGLRAAAALLTMLPGRSGARRGDPDERKHALEGFLAELGRMPLEAGDRRTLTLLGHLGAAPNPFAWQPASDEEKATFARLATEAPCDPEAFALRALVARPDRARLGALVKEVIGRCASAPDGAATTVNAMAMYLELGHESPPLITEDLDAAILAFGRAHDDDPEAIGVHADAVALKALTAAKGPSQVALEAALARYEQAIARWTPAGGGPLRQRLEENAGYLSIALGRLIGHTNEDLASSFYLRSGGHIRAALALGEIPPVTALRALYDIDTGTGTTVTTLDLEHMPASRGRNRAACMFAVQASARGDRKITKQLLDLALEHPAEERKLSVAELQVDNDLSLSVRLEGEVLAPFVDLKTSVFLAPACDPELVKLPPDAKPAAKK